MPHIINSITTPHSPSITQKKDEYFRIIKQNQKGLSRIHFSHYDILFWTLEVEREGKASSNIKIQMMIKVVISLTTFSQILFQIFALNALAIWPTSHSHAVALAVFLKAVAFEAFAFDLEGHGPSQEELLPVPAVLALAFGSAGLTQFEALAVIFLTASLGACTLADGLRIGAGRGGSVGNLEAALIFKIGDGCLEDGWLIIIVEGVLLGDLRLAPQQVEQVRVIFSLLQAIHHDHDLLLHLHLLGPLLTIHIKLKQYSQQYSQSLKSCSLPQLLTLIYEKHALTLLEKNTKRLKGAEMMR